MITRFQSFSAALAVLLAGSALHAAETNSVSGTDFPSFKIISERNIFSPGRSSRAATVVAKPKPVKVDTFTLVGASSSETGRFAFFDGSSPEFRKVVKRGDNIAGFKVADISWNRVKLVSTNGPTEMTLQSQMKRQDDGEWNLNATPEPTVSSSAATGSAQAGNPESAPSGGESDVLKKLMQKREEELKNEGK